MSTIFCDECTKFRAVNEDGSVHIDSFLTAAHNIVRLFEMFGSAFKPVKNDVENNIAKLRKQQSSNNYQTFHDMVKEEMKRKTTRHGQSGTVALLWLKRSLQLTLQFCQLLIQDHKNNVKTENIGPFVRHAYDSTLRPYHGWIVQKLVAVVSRAVPYRRDLLRTMAFGTDGMEDQVIDGMAESIEHLEENLNSIQKLYSEHDLDFADKV